MKKIHFVTLGLFMMLITLSGVMAIQDNSVGVACRFLDSSNLPIANADVNVMIYNQSIGGTLLYNETFINSTNNAGYCTIDYLGSATNIVNVTQGDTLYLDLTVDGEDFDFNGAERKEFNAWFGSTDFSGANFLAPDGNGENLTNVVTGDGEVNQYVRIGDGALVEENSVADIAIGRDASTRNNIAYDGFNIAIGYDAEARGAGTAYGATAIGYQTRANVQETIAIGWRAAATGFGSIGLGGLSKATGIESVAIGNQAEATGTNTVAIGYDIVNSQAQSFLFGYNNIPYMRVNATGAYVTNESEQLATQQYVLDNAGGGLGLTNSEANDSFDGYISGISADDTGIGFYESGQTVGYDSAAIVVDADNNYNALYIQPNLVYLENQNPNGILQLIDRNNTFRFRSGIGNEYTNFDIRTNANAGTVVFPETGNLATEAYVLANAGGVGTDDIGDNEINYSQVTLSDFTNDAGYLAQDGNGENLTGVVTGTGSAGSTVILGTSTSEGTSQVENVIIGAGSLTSGTGGGSNVVIGDAARADGTNPFAQISIGRGAVTNNDYTIAIGENAAANAVEGIAIGTRTTSGGSESIAIGNYVVNNQGRSAVIGWGGAGGSGSFVNDQANSFLVGYESGNVNNFIRLLRANNTGVYDVTEQKLATEAYVDANIVSPTGSYITYSGTLLNTSGGTTESLLLEQTTPLTLEVNQTVLIEGSVTGGRTSAGGNPILYLYVDDVFVANLGTITDSPAETKTYITDYVVTGGIGSSANVQIRTNSTSGTWAVRSGVLKISLLAS